MLSYNMENFQIPPEKILDFLEAFSSLFPAEQKIFIFIIKNKHGIVRLYSRDIADISYALSISRKTVQKSIKKLAETRPFSLVTKLISKRSFKTLKYDWWQEYYDYQYNKGYSDD